MGTRPVIGVFGSSKDVPQVVLQAAAELAAQLAVHPQQPIVLTGASGLGHGHRTVKDRALDAAARANARWIAVDRHGPVGHEAASRSFIVRSALGDARNFLEAALCDGAICLPGGVGTQSELVFALSMGKPIALWPGQWGDAVLQAPQGIIDGPAGLLQSSPPDGVLDVVAQSAWDVVEAQAQCLAPSNADAQAPAVSARLKGSRPFLVLQPETAKQMVDRLVTAIGSNLRGAFPEISTLAFERTAYSEWLALQRHMEGDGTEQKISS